MKRFGLALVNKGLETAAKDNILEILDDDKHDKDKSERTFHVIDGAVLFSIDGYPELCRLSYLSQSINRLFYVVDKIKFDDYDDLLNKFSIMLKDDDISKIYPLISSCTTFRVKSLVEDKELKDYSMEIEQNVGESLFEHFKDVTKDSSDSSDFSDIKLLLKVNLRDPELVFYIFIKDSTAYFCIDFSGDISKRDYKIFNSSMSLKGTTAFGVLKLAGYSPKDHILNIFCNSGTLEIEAALYANDVPVRYYNKNFPFMRLKIQDDKMQSDDSGSIDWGKFFSKIDKKMSDKKLPITASDPLLKNITAAKKNAKIAGCEKFIEFRRIDTDWLDLKFEEKSIDKMMTFIPGSSKHKNDRSLQKLFKEFFYQAEYILKDSGMLSILCLRKDLLLDISKEHFRLLREEEFYSGEQQMAVLIFKKIKITGEKF